MALKNLTSEEMLQLSGNWIDPKSPAHAAIITVPELAAKLQRMGDTHGGLANAAQPPENPRLAQISAEEGPIDLRHDAIIRGIFGHLTATAELVGGEAGEQLIALRDKLIPDGLSSQQKTYRAEAGQAAQLADRLTADVLKQTDAIIVGQGAAAKSLTEYLKEWITLGKQLGALEDEKGKILAEQADAATGTALVKARNQWIRLVNSFIADGALAQLDDGTDALVFGPLRDAGKKADARVRAAAGKSGKGGTGADGAGQGTHEGGTGQAGA
jgi:hypothetical protein